MALVIKKLPANAGDIRNLHVRSLGQEDPWEEGMAIHSSILAWKTPWTEEPGGLQSIGSQSQTQLKRLSTHVLIYTTYPSNVIGFIVHWVFCFCFFQISFSHIYITKSYLLFKVLS